MQNNGTNSPKKSAKGIDSIDYKMKRSPHKTDPEA